MDSDPYIGKPAGFWIRFLAQYVDGAFIGLTTILLSLLFRIIFNFIHTPDPYVDSGPGFSTFLGLLFFVAAIYYSWMTAIPGQTFGKRRFNLKVVDKEGNLLEAPESFWRFCCYFLSLATFYLGFVIAAFSPEKKALHDYVAGTQVVYTGRPSKKVILQETSTIAFIVLIFTLLTLMIVPKFTNMLEKSREGSTKGNWGTLNEAISLYHKDHGVWPSALDTSPQNPFSRYIDSIPPVKVNGAYVSGSKSPAGNIVTLTTRGAVPTGSGKGWLYDSNTGAVYVNSTVKDSKGIPYSFYGFE
jgi:uncharacterized RDD family membrane protein YckC